MTNNLPDATLIDEGAKLPVVAWQERASRYVNPQGAITSWSHWYDCRGPAKDYVKPENPIQEVTYEWRSLTTIAAANEAIEQAKLRPAPCARYCEAQAFNIELRQKDGRIAELEESIDQRDSYIKSLERLFDSTFIAGQDKNLQRIAELEAVVKQAGEAIASFKLPEESIVGAQAGNLILRVPFTTIQAQAAALAAIDALGVK